MKAEPLHIIQNSRRRAFLKVLIEVNENEDPVRIKIDRKFYKQLEKKAETLETTPDTIINNTLLLTLKKLEEKVGTR